MLNLILHFVALAAIVWLGVGVDGVLEICIVIAVVSGIILWHIFKIRESLEELKAKQKENELS